MKNTQIHYKNVKDPLFAILREVIYSKCVSLTYIYSKTCLKRPLVKKTKYFFKSDYGLMQVKSIAECSKRAFCNTFDLHNANICL